MIINMKGRVIVPKEIITNMYSMNYDYKANEIGTEINKTTTTRDCNCNWTCDSYVVVPHQTVNFKSGCGFYGHFMRRRVGPVL
jgi:hypothetical protein